MNFNTPTQTAKIQVQRRVAVPTHGWNEFLKPEEPTSYVPTLEELIFAIYDAQREIIGSMYPKRFKSKILVPIKNIERLYHTNPSAMRFDGMSHERATEHYRQKSLEIGVRNDWSIPFIFAEEITLKHPAFNDGFSHIFRVENGLRYQVQGTTHEFHYMSTSRILASNLSYHLNLKYNCNLHIANDEAWRAMNNTGEMVVANRALFTDACNYYMEPHLLDPITYTRAQVKQLREYSSEEIQKLIGNIDAVMEYDPVLAYELDRARAIYQRQIKQFVGDYSQERICE